MNLTNSYIKYRAICSLYSLDWWRFAGSQRLCWSSSCWHNRSKLSCCKIERCSDSNKSLEFIIVVANPVMELVIVWGSYTNFETILIFLIIVKIFHIQFLYLHYYVPLGDESHAAFIHCYRHTLNLATADVIWNVKCLNNTVNTMYSASVIAFKVSTPRQGTPGFRT